MFSLSFAAQPDEWDLLVLENHYIDSIMLTTVLDGVQNTDRKKENTGNVFYSSDCLKYWNEISVFMNNWLIN